MAMKFGGDYELKNVDIKTSTLEARKLFLNLIWEMKPKAVLDLTRLFNIDSHPDEWLKKPFGWQEDNYEIRYAKRLFLLHTKEPNRYSFDLTRLGIKSNARQTPVLAYFDFLFKNQAELDKLTIESEKKWNLFTHNPKQKLITARALEMLIPDLKTLQLKEGSEWLCENLIGWAKKWNLKDDWCLDFALSCLHIFKTELIDELRLREDYLENGKNLSLRELNKFCRDGAAWKTAISLLSHNNVDNHLIVPSKYSHNQEIEGKLLTIPSKYPNYPMFKYVWEEETNRETKEIFEITNYFNPFAGRKEKFRKDIEKDFWRTFFEHFQEDKTDFTGANGNNWKVCLGEPKWTKFMGNPKKIVEEHKKLHKCIDEYILRIKKTIKRDAVKTFEKREGDKHFRWLIEYQIPKVKTFEEIANKEFVDRKAVSRDIRGVAKILILKLHLPSRGRPKKTI